MKKKNRASPQTPEAEAAAMVAALEAEGIRDAEQVKDLIADYNALAAPISDHASEI